MDGILYGVRDDAEPMKGEMGILFTVEHFLDGKRMRGAFLREDNPFCVSRSHGWHEMRGRNNAARRGILRKIGAKNQFAFPPKFPIGSR